MKRLLALLFGFFLLSVPSLAHGHRGDHGDDHEHGDGEHCGCDDHEQSCQPTGPCSAFRGVAFELCDAYCGELKCATPHPNTCAWACSWVKQTFQALTGQGLPCEQQVACPCGAALPLFASIVAGTATVQQCISDTVSQVTSVATPEGTFVVVNQTAAPPYCSANLTDFLQITPEQAAVCQQALLQAATAQGVTCAPPE